MSTFDPSSVQELRTSPRLPELRAIFAAIAKGEPANKVWLMANKFTQKSNAVERERIPDLVEKELEKR
jgi:hypothetical protein